MQLYHHPLSLNSQMVRLALEEKGLEYEEHIVNPLKARNLDADFFRQNPSGSIPLLIHGNEVLYKILPIIQYINSINEPLGWEKVDQEKVQEWIQKIDAWDPKLFTLSHFPDGALRFFSKFRRRVVIARMAQNPDLATDYHLKLQSIHAMEENLKDEKALAASEQQLASLLDAAEVQLSSTNCLAGAVFSVADCMFIPILARIEFLRVEECFQKRPRVIEYWAQMKERTSYYDVIGQYVTPIGKAKILVPAVCNMSMRRLFKMY
eukprot:c22067_g1_i1 orf=311-1102(-)